jgi:Xaa-Pro dipeptidase
MQLRISESEYARRRRDLLAKLAAQGQDGLVCFGTNNVFYLSAFAMIPTERPMAYVLNGSGRSALLVPRLELEHAEENALVDCVRSYPEYPGDRHPMQFLADLVKELGLGAARIGVDADGYGAIYGYRGPRLSEVLPEAKVTSVRDTIEDMQMINSPEEVALVRESTRWANLAHRLLQEYCRDGATENEVSARASYEATQTMIKTLGRDYRPLSSGRAGASAGFRGQIGKGSALPHAITTNAVMRRGDVLVTGAGASVWGYSCELERTMILGQPTREQAEYFQHMLNLQDIALEAIKPGIPCSEVDKAVWRYFEEHNLQSTWRHHSGHAKSTQVHEAPFLDRGDNRIIQPGMIFTVEPGIYVNGFAGFRHSDTVVVTDTGIEMLTFYPRDLESLTIPA